MMNVDEMVMILSKKLTKEEFMSLFLLMDQDPPAGPFMDAVAAQAEILCPEEFNSSCDSMKVVNSNSDSENDIRYCGAW